MGLFCSDNPFFTINIRRTSFFVTDAFVFNDFYTMGFNCQLTNYIPWKALKQRCIWVCTKTVHSKCELWLVSPWCEWTALFKPYKNKYYLLILCSFCIKDCWGHRQTFLSEGEWAVYLCPCIFILIHRSVEWKKRGKIIKRRQSSPEPLDGSKTYCTVEEDHFWLACRDYIHSSCYAFIHRHKWF